MTPDDRAVVVGGDPRRLERYVTGCRWAWLAAVVLAGAIALLEHERQGGASLTILAAAVAVVGAVASLPLWARRLRLTTLALSTAVVAAAPLASLAWMALAIVGDFPEQAALARRYWVVYPVMMATTFASAFGDARASARSRVSAMMAALPGAPREAAQVLVFGQAARAGGFRRIGSLAVLGHWVGALVASVIGRGAYFWGLSLVMASSFTLVSTYVVIRQWHVAAALRGRDDRFELFPRRALQRAPR